MTHGRRCLELVRGSDIVHGHYSYFLSAVFGSFCRRIRRSFVVTLHGLNTLDSSVGRSLTKRMLRSVSIRAADRVLATSEEMAVVARRFVPEQRIMPVPNAVNSEDFIEIADYLPPSPPFRVLSVRRLVPKNGVQYLVEAAPAILGRMGSRVEFWIVGDGRLRGYLEQRVQELGVGDYFHFFGALPNGRIKDCLREAHVVVFPSSAESTSIAALEAMAARRPVVASSVGAFPALLGDGARGRLVVLFDRTHSDYVAPLTLPVPQIEALTDAVIWAITNREAALQLATIGQRFVTENYDWRIISGQIETIYSKSSPTLPQHNNTHHGASLSSG